MGYLRFQKISRNDTRTVFRKERMHDESEKTGELMMLLPPKAKYLSQYIRELFDLLHLQAEEINKTRLKVVVSYHPQYDIKQFQPLIRN